VLLSGAPALIVIFSRVFYKQPTPRSQLVGGTLSLVGALTIITRGNSATLSGFQHNSGDWLMIIAVLIWAVYCLQLQRRPQELTPWALLAATVIVGVAVATPLYIWELTTGARMPFTAETITAVLYTSLCAAIGGYFLWSKGVAAIGANKAGLFLHLIPVFAAVMAFICLDETVRLFQVIGIGLVLVGLYLTNVTRRSELGDVSRVH
jgi:drug/metabolite transporter (DMT)-like permease